MVWQDWPDHSPRTQNLAVNDSDLYHAQSWAQARITRLGVLAEKRFYGQVDWIRKLWPTFLTAFQGCLLRYLTGGRLTGGRPLARNSLNLPQRAR